MTSLKLTFFDIIWGAQVLGARLPVTLNFVDCLWVLSLELAVCHLSGAWNSEETSRFLENMFIPHLNTNGIFLSRLNTTT